MNHSLPPPVEVFRDEHAEVWAAFERLADACHTAGPLDDRSRRLVKLALAIGAGLEGATHSAVRQARDAGLSPAEINHTAILAISTLGFPSAMRALTWIHDALNAPVGAIPRPAGG